MNRQVESFEARQDLFFLRRIVNLFRVYEVNFLPLFLLVRIEHLLSFFCLLLFPLFLFMFLFFLFPLLLLSLLYISQLTFLRFLRFFLLFVFLF